MTIPGPKSSGPDPEAWVPLAQNCAVVASLPRGVAAVHTELVDPEQGPQEMWPWAFGVSPTPVYPFKLHPIPLPPRPGAQILPYSIHVAIISITCPPVSPGQSQGVWGRGWGVVAGSVAADNGQPGQGVGEGCSVTPSQSWGPPDCSSTGQNGTTGHDVPRGEGGLGTFHCLPQCGLLGPKSSPPPVSCRPSCPQHPPSSSTQLP